MKRTVLLLFIFFKILLTVSADSLEQTYAALRDDMYNQAKTSADIHQEIKDAISRVEQEFDSREEQLFWKAKFEYIAARVYMEKDMATKKDFEKFRSEKAEKHFEAAYDMLADSLKIKEDSEVLTLRADILGQLCLLKGRSYTISNGLDIRKMTERALELNPENGKAWVLKANDRVYTPKIFGGSPKDGISLFEKAETMPNIEKDDLFNIYSGIGVAWQKQKKNDQARFWMNKALAIYPENIYIKRMMEEL